MDGKTASKAEQQDNVNSAEDTVTDGRERREGLSLLFGPVPFGSSQNTDTGPTSPSADPITPGAWQGRHWSASLCHWYDSTRKIPSQAGFECRVFHCRGRRLNH